VVAKVTMTGIVVSQYKLRISCLKIITLVQELQFYTLICAICYIGLPVYLLAYSLFITLYQVFNITLCKLVSIHSGSYLCHSNVNASLVYSTHSLTHIILYCLVVMSCIFSHINIFSPSINKSYIPVPGIPFIRI